MESILYSLSTVSPIFIIIGIGAFLRRIGLIGTSLSGHLTKLVFYLFLPALLLRSVLGMNPFSSITLPVLAVILLTLLTNFIFAWMLGTFLGKGGIGRGMFASGCCWGNVAIIGYALAEALYGEAGLTRAVVFSGLTLPLHILMGYTAMGRSLSNLPNRLLTNPIILTLLLSLALSLLPLRMPEVAMDILGILGQASLPLALVAIGGSLEFRRPQSHLNESLTISAVKLLFMPTLAFFIAYLFNLETAWTGSIVVGFSCPIAISFFVISRSMGIEASRGAAIITTTTVTSSITTGLVAIFLKARGYT